jgi:hypothetical protein
MADQNVPAPAAAAVPGNAPAFEFENNIETENFNLRHPPDLHSPIPEDQRSAIAL